MNATYTEEIQMGLTTDGEITWLKGWDLLRAAAAEWTWDDVRDAEIQKAHAKDRAGLEAIAEAVAVGELEYAMQLAGNLDTIVRELIPAPVWKLMGGTLISEL